MKVTRKRYSAEFKAKVAMEAIRGDLTLAELAAKHGVHHTMIGAWKRQAMDGMASLFDGGDQAAKASSEAEIEKLHAKIGQLLVERDFGTSLRSMSMDRRRKMVEPNNPDLSIMAQCRLLSLSRSGYYYAPVAENGATLALMTVIDQVFMDCPWYGSRQTFSILPPHRPIGLAGHADEIVEHFVTVCAVPHQDGLDRALGIGDRHGHHGARLKAHDAARKDRDAKSRADQAQDPQRIGHLVTAGFDLHPGPGEDIGQMAPEKSHSAMLPRMSG
jgi:transposase